MKLLKLTHTLENMEKIISKKLLKDKKEKSTSTEKPLSDFSKSLLSLIEITKYLRKESRKKKQK
jgi:hypothetical protein